MSDQASKTRARGDADASENRVSDNHVPSANTRWYWLLLIPYIAIFWLPSYNKVEPLAWGVPFFYWYQLLWVVLSTLVIGVVFHFAHNSRKR